MNPGCFTALLVGLAEVGSCTMCFFCIPYVLSEFNWWTAEHQHNLMFTETASGLFQEFSFSIHRVVLCWERLWCWVRMVFLRLSSLTYPAWQCSSTALEQFWSGKGAMVHPVCRELCTPVHTPHFLPGISGLQKSQWAGRHYTTYFQAGFWVSWLASTILNATGSVKVLHLPR